MPTAQTNQAYYFSQMDQRLALAQSHGQGGGGQGALTNVGVQQNQKLLGLARQIAQGHNPYQRDSRGQGTIEVAGKVMKKPKRRYLRFALLIGCNTILSCPFVFLSLCSNVPLLPPPHTHTLSLFLSLSPLCRIAVLSPFATFQSSAHSGGWAPARAWSVAPARTVPAAARSSFPSSPPHIRGSTRR